MQNKIRTFICFELSNNIRDQLQTIQNQLKPKHNGVKWVKPESIHLTLLFLGDIEQEQVDRVIRAVQTACESIRPFTLTLKDTGAFPDFKRPRVFWVGVSDKDQQLIRCYEKIESELEHSGFPKEKRSFSPHLTIGRVKNSQGISRISTELEAMKPDPISFPAREVVVMQSKLMPSGAVYTPLKKIEL